MLQTKYLLDHVDALLLLSHDVGDRAIAAKLREMADEFRIMVSVADISNLAATLSKNSAPAAAIAPASDAIGPEAGTRKAPASASDDTAVGPSRVSHARYNGINRHLRVREGRRAVASCVRYAAGSLDGTCLIEMTGTKMARP
jgi:hypothetical protein